MKAAAFLLLVACSPSVALVPSSLPMVRVDRTLSGVVCSRDAAEAIAIRREAERGQAADALIECNGRAKLAGKLMEEANKRASSNAWWGTWGATLVLGSVLLSLGAGFAVGWSVAR